MPKSVIDQLKALDEQRTKLLDGARSEALQKAQAAVDELNELGFSYVLREGDGRGKRAGSRKGTRQVDPNKACPICGFITDPPHDGRAHRAQGEKKRPFSADELSGMGLRRT